MRRVTLVEGKIMLKYQATDFIDAATGMVIPAAAQLKQQITTGIVCDMGYDKAYKFKTAFGEERQLNNGDIVLFDRHRGTEYTFDGVKYIVIDILQLTGVIDED